MARLARVVVPNYFHHVTQRGVRSMNIFASDDDRIKYLNLLKEYGKKYGLIFVAYCLMDNHVHLIVIPKTEHSLADALGETHKQYTRLFNLRCRVKGFLFQGRFFSCLLDNRHTIAAIAYVERNPVRIGLVKNAWDYTWSSAMFHVGLRKTDPLVEYIDALDEISNWRDFLSKEPLEIDNLRKKIRSGRLCGEESFVKSIEKITGRMLEPCKVGRHKKIL
jgi:putative transposase